MNYEVHFPYMTFIIQSPISIEEFFQQFHLSKKTIHLYKQNKEYTVNKRFVSSTTILLKGDRFTVKAFETNDNMYSPQYKELDIVYEDEFILVVNKPPLIYSLAKDTHQTDSLSHIVSGYYQQCGLDIPVHCLHPLDYETSGLALFCKCTFILPLLEKYLLQKEIKFKYLSIVTGTMNDYYVHSVRKMISRDRHYYQKMTITKSGKEACTHYQCLATHNNLSYIECSLETERKHQIRVHMASVGHPILGDTLYGQASSLINRQALHAHQLQLIHPITKEKMTLMCHPPIDMKQIIHDIDPIF